MPSNTKTYLQQLYWLKRNITRLKEQISDLEKDIADIRASDYSKDRVSISVRTSAVEEAALKLESHREALVVKQKEYGLLRAKIENEIESLDNEVYKELLSLRYIQCKRWERVALLMGYSEAHVFELHREALAYFNAHKHHSKS